MKVKSNQANVTSASVLHLHGLYTHVCACSWAFSGTNTHTHKHVQIPPTHKWIKKIKQREDLKVTPLFSRAIAAFTKNPGGTTNIGSTHMDEALRHRKGTREECRDMDRDLDRTANIFHSQHCYGAFCSSVWTPDRHVLPTERVFQLTTVWAGISKWVLPVLSNLPSKLAGCLYYKWVLNCL